jgi:hypothetical protein
VERRRTMIWLLVATSVYLVGSPFAVGAALMSVMAFDAPGSENNPATILFALSIFTLPVTLVVGALSAWALFFFRKHRAAVLAVLLPVVNLLLFIAAFVWLQVVYGGSLAGS